MDKRAVFAASAALLFVLPGVAHAMPPAPHPPFDVERATRAYLALLQGPARAKSDAYFEGGYWLPLWGTLISLAVYWALLASGWSARMRNWAERVGTRRWLAPALYALPFGIVTALATLPWSIYTDFIREKQYGLSNQTFAAWAGDAAKSGLIALVVSALVYLVILAVIRRFPRGWWLLGAGLMSAFVAIGALVAPVFIAPLFNRYTELPPGPLRDRLVAVAAANHIPAEHIYVSDASRQSKRISANVSGIGPTVRITLNDNLLHRTEPDEVLAVMGHEMGHYVLGHIYKLIAAFTLVFLLIFFAVARAGPALIRHFPGWGVRDVADPAGLPVLLALAGVAGLVLTPVQNSITRAVEAEADAFGLDAAREPDGFATAAIRLSEYRKLEPGPVEEMFFFDHPSGYTRIRRAMEWKAAHVPGATIVHPDPALLKR